nr:MAG TPA: hypothetical protein [Caudoviricetes sp.]
MLATGNAAATLFSEIKCAANANKDDAICRILF